MRIGIVCPYSFDAPGGVQVHIKDLAEELIRRGHHVSVLAPAKGVEGLPWLVSTGAAVSIPFNGSVARLSIGPVTASRTRRWLKEGDFDVVHIHEPESPSVGLIALMHANVPVVGTFHAAMERSRARSLAAGLLSPLMEKLAARIAVSQEARRTLVEHHAGDAVVIPNGVYTSAFANAKPLLKWQSTAERPVIVFLGRLDEPRKGLHIFAGAIETILAKHPGTRFLVAGRGEAESLSEVLKKYPDSVTLLGEISDEEKASLLAGASVYIAPQRGGESFGIVLVEAMAADTLVIASDIAAFRAVLDGGEAGILFRNGDSADLADKVCKALDDPERSATLARAGARRSAMYDWITVTDQILAVYDAVVPWGAPPVTGTQYEKIVGRLGRGES